MNGKQFSIGDALKCGFNCAWENIRVLLLAMISMWAVVIGLGIITVLANFPLMRNLAPLMMEIQKCVSPECITVINTQMRSMVTGANGLLFGGIFFLFTIVMLGVGLGFIKLALNICDKANPQVKDLFSCFDKRLISSFFAGILFSALSFCGFVLFIIPGFIVLARFGYYMFFIVDKHVGPIDSLGQSWHTTKGNTFRLIGFALILGALFFVLSFIPLSQLITGPLGIVIMACAYRQLVPRS